MHSPVTGADLSRIAEETFSSKELCTRRSTHACHVSRKRHSAETERNKNVRSN